VKTKKSVILFFIPRYRVIGKKRKFNTIKGKKTKTNNANPNTSHLSPGSIKILAKAIRPRKTTI